MHHDRQTAVAIGRLRLSDQEKYPLKLSDLMVTALDTRLAPVKWAWCNDPNNVINDLPNVGLRNDRFYRPLFMSQDLTEYTGCVMAIDPSGRGKDETSYAIVKHLFGFLFVVAVGGFKKGYAEETLSALAALAKLHSVNHVVVEANFGDGMFTQLLKPVFSKIHPCAMEEVKHSTQKERRICDTLEPVMNQHRLIFDSSVVRKDAESEPRNQLFYQLTRMTRERGAVAADDRADVLSIAVAYWVESMARDGDKAAEEHRATQIEAELRNFVNLASTSSGLALNTFSGANYEATW